MKLLMELRGVRKSYGAFKVPEDISLSVYPGELIIIRGRSGVGKTILLNIMGLIDRPDKGRTLFDGVDVTNLEGIPSTKTHKNPLPQKLLTTLES